MLDFLLRFFQPKIAAPIPEVVPPQNTKPEQVILVKKHMTKNFNKSRPAKISAFIVHCMSGIYVDPQNPFDPELNVRILEDNNVSAHYLIPREGNEVWELVPEEFNAWHAGVSELGGVKNVNGFSVGVELIGLIGGEFTDSQYDRLIWLAKKFKEKYKVSSRARYVGHEHISPGRKKDPGKKFDWDRFYTGVGL